MAAEAGTSSLTSPAEELSDPVSSLFVLLVMKSLVRRVLEKGGEEGGEAWLRRCLALVLGEEPNMSENRGGRSPEEGVEAALSRGGARRAVKRAKAQYTAESDKCRFMR